MPSTHVEPALAWVMCSRLGVFFKNPNMPAKLRSAAKGCRAEFRARKSRAFRPAPFPKIGRDRRRELDDQPTLVARVVAEPAQGCIQRSGRTSLDDVCRHRPA